RSPAAPGICPLWWPQTRRQVSTLDGASGRPRHPEGIFWGGPEEVDLTSPNLFPSMSTIAALNDAFRRTVAGGTVFVTAGIAALPRESQERIIAKVLSFDAFTADNDPYGASTTSGPLRSRK